MGLKEDKEYEKWLKGFKESLSEEEVEAFDKLVASEQGDKLFRGPVFREKEFNIRIQELAELKKENEKWFRDNNSTFQTMKQEKEAALKEVAELREKAGQGSGNPPPAAEVVAKGQPGINPDEIADLKKRVELMDNALPKLLGQWGTIVKTIAEEKYDLDPQEVIDYSIQHRVDPYKAFEDLTYEERKKRFDSDRKKELDAAKEAGRREALASRSLPDVHRPSGPSVVDFLREKEPSADFTDMNARRAAAVKEFNETDWSKAEMATRTGI